MFPDGDVRRYPRDIPSVMVGVPGSRLEGYGPGHIAPALHFGCRIRRRVNDRRVEQSKPTKCDMSGPDVTLSRRVPSLWQFHPPPEGQNSAALTR